jgi:hypothetical protein
MPLKINEDQSRLANDLDHEIQQIKTCLNHDDSEEMGVNLDELDADYLG